MKVFLIAPHSKDKYFDKKVKILTSIFAKFGIETLTGVIDEKGDFNFDKSLELYHLVDLFIADLSFERPSCYYEVGYAQALKKKVFLIAKVNTLIHQVNNKTEISFYKSLKDYTILIEKIVKDVKSNY